MATLKSYGKQIDNIFQLLGDSENAISQAVSWALSQCPAFLSRVVENLTKVKPDVDATEIRFQRYDPDQGITDIEITDEKEFYIIIEAKKGWLLPGGDQLTKYSVRPEFLGSMAKSKLIVTMSEAKMNYAQSHLPFKKTPNGIEVMHLPWEKVYRLANDSLSDSNNAEKRILGDLMGYIGGLMSSQNQTTNMVYVVSLGSGNPEGCSLSWIDIVNQKHLYFHPVGGKGWPKEPVNYIAFRYWGKLQSIHHIEGYDVETDMHKKISEMPHTEWEDHFIYRLGPAIRPDHEVKTGNIYPSGRVWAMLDLLLTANTISEARDMTKERMQANKTN